MQPRGASLRLAPDSESTLPSGQDRTAGVITLAGCVTTLLAVILPWAEKGLFGVSLVAFVNQDASLLLAVLTATSAGTAGAVLLRRPAGAALAMILIVLALAQFAVAIWGGVTILQAISQAGSHQVLIGAIGTGAYGGVMGSVIVLAGGVVAWTERRRG